MQNGSRLHEFFLQIDRRPHPDIVEIIREPFGGAGATAGAPHGQEMPVALHLALRRQVRHGDVGAHRMDQDMFQLVQVLILDPAIV